MAKPDFTTQDATTYKTNIDLEVGNLMDNAPQITEVTHSSLTGVNDLFSSLPAGLTHIEASFANVSSNGNQRFVCQIGDSGGLHTTGYQGAVHSRSSTANSLQVATTALLINNGSSAAGQNHGRVVMTLVDPTNHIWEMDSQCWEQGNNRMCNSATRVALDTALDRVDFNWGGTDTFDAGVITLRYY